MTEAEQGGRQLPSALLVVLYLAFALTGVLTALPGPLLPILLKKWLLNDAHAGWIVGAQFLGNLFGCLFTNRNPRLSRLLGLALVAIGTGTFVFLRWPGLLASFFCYGMGLGLAIPAINLTIAAAAAPNKRSAALNLLNSVWGLGAISAPTLVLASQHLASIEKLLAALGMSAALLLALSLSGPKVVAAANTNQAASKKAAHSLLFFAMGFFLYVGTETCIASWISVFAQRTFPNAHLLGFSVVTYFWAALVLGRAVSAYVLKWTSERSLYIAAAAIALLAFCAILGGKIPSVVALGTILCGLALAPIFPILLSYAADTFLTHPNSGWVFACAPLGGTLLPWATGQLSTAYATLHIGLLVPPAAILCLLAMGFGLAGEAKISHSTVIET